MILELSITNISWRTPVLTAAHLPLSKLCVFTRDDCAMKEPRSCGRRGTEACHGLQGRQDTGPAPLCIPAALLGRASALKTQQLLCQQMHSIRNVFKGPLHL
jgi:hypothetical protein